MKKYYVFLCTAFVIINSYGQTCVQEKIEIKYNNGFEVFYICKTNPTIVFKDEKEYYWYNEYSLVKSSEGGCGGNLLHGNYKFFDEYGNLKQEMNFYFGIKNGNSTEWDSNGNITTKAKYAMGDLVYWKFLNDEENWIEWTGRIFEVGSIKKVTTKHGNLLSEEKYLPGSKMSVKTYYEFPKNQLKEAYTQNWLFDDMYYGKMTTYYSNGKIEIEGQFHNGEYPNIRIGVWKWHNEDGTLNDQETYKAEITKWPNGKIKTIGGMKLNSENNEWVRIDVWRWFNSEGELDETKDYGNGSEKITN